jgi:hypothetical protein
MALSAFSLAAQPRSHYNGAVAGHSIRRASRSKRPVRSNSKGASPHYLTNPEGERRAIILGMDHYVKLLAELNSLRALVARYGLTVPSPRIGPPAGQRAGRRPAR